jgi:hypothetical protein
MNKPDPARGWQYAMKLLAEEELERLDKMSDEEVADEMRAEGLDPTRVPSVETLLAKVPDAEQLLAEVPAGARVVPLEPWKRTRWAVWLAAAALGVVVVAILALKSPAVVAWWHGGKPADIGADAAPPPPSELVRAEALRDDAERACQRKLWGTCESKLDEASALDPASEHQARVVRMRGDIAASVRDQTPDTKRGPGPAPSSKKGPP